MYEGRRVALVALMGVLGACERAPTALDLSGERLMVHSVLIAEREVVQVLVERVSPLPVPDPASGASLDVRPVSGAEVEMRLDGEVITLREAPPEMPPCASASPFPVPQPEPIGPGCYAASVPGGVQPGSRVELVVRVGGEVVASGEAVVPTLPTLNSPAAGGQHDVILGPPTFGDPVPGIMLRYRLPTEVGGLGTSLAFDSTYVDGERVAGATCGYDPFGNAPVWREEQVDSVVFIPRGLHCFRPAPSGGNETFLPDSIFARLSLAAFDSAYMTYDEAARRQSAELESLQAGVTGALGLFAGVSLARTPVVLVPIGWVR